MYSLSIYEWLGLFADPFWGKYFKLMLVIIPLNTFYISKKNAEKQKKKG